MFYPEINKESGMVLLVTLLVTLISTIVASSFMSLTVYESKHSVWQKHEAQALFLAEAGVEKALYYLNNTEDSANPWVDESDEMLPTPQVHTDNLAYGYYDIKLYGMNNKPWLPENSYLVESTGIIPRSNGGDIKRGVSCIVRKLDKIPIPAALAVLDSADPEVELNQFSSSQWTIDGTDMDDIANSGLPGIAIANLALSQPDGIVGDDLLAQLGERISQVTGANEASDSFTGVDAILEDPSLPQDLDAYANYFERIAIDISGVSNIPREHLGSQDDPQVLYADLTQGPIRILPNQPGYGIMVLDGVGDFSIEGGADWFGIIICARDSHVNLNGGGTSTAHIYGALLIANGVANMNGTADIVYSSDNVNNLNALLLYQVYSWCGDWGTPISTYGYDPIASGGTGD